MSIAPTTELEAVNEMLTAIGTMPVNTLEVAGLTDAAIARDTLRSITRELQSSGWWFNSSRNVTLNPAAGVIAVPNGALRVTPALSTATTVGESTQFVTRNNRLLNAVTNSDTTWSAAVRADIVYSMTFENMPESARRYAAVRAARVFQTKVLGNETLGVFTEAHESDAWMILEGDHRVSSPSSVYLDRIRTRFSGVRRPPASYRNGAEQPQS